MNPLKHDYSCHSGDCHWWSYRVCDCGYLMRANSHDFGEPSEQVIKDWLEHLANCECHGIGAPDGFNFPNSERQGSVDIAELAAYVREQARVADANCTEWAKGAEGWTKEGSNLQSAYRSGMWYAYRDILNRLSPEAYKVTVPGKEGK